MAEKRRNKRLEAEKDSSGKEAKVSKAAQLDVITVELAGKHDILETAFH
jgi:hypothetical protein